MEVTSVTCSGCELGLDESPKAKQRQPCPRCGSTARTFHATGGATVRVRASFAWEKWHSFYERRPLLIAAAALLTVAGSLSGLAIHGVLGLLAGLALSVIASWIGVGAITKVREVEKGRAG